ncbi:hypothetical protein [Salana multivorans]
MTSTDDPTGPRRGDRAGISTVLVLGVFAGGFLAARGLISGIFRLADPGYAPISLLADIPVEHGDGVLDATGTTLLVHADTLPTGTVWLLAIADVVFGLALAGIVASAAYVLWGIVRHRPFHRRSHLAAIVAGASLTFGSLLSQGVGGIGLMMAADELNDALGGVALPAFELDPLPIISGLAIVALSYVFRAGERLQRDTEGLI